MHLLNQPSFVEPLQFGLVPQNRILGSYGVGFTTDVTETAEIRIRQIGILHFKSVRFGSATQSQLVQFSQVKNAKLCLKFKGMY